MIGYLRRSTVFPRLRVLLGLSLLTALAFVLPTPKTASAHLRHFTPKPQDKLTLEPGKAIERRLAPDETHHYRLALNPGEFLRLVIERTTMDVVMTARTPGGEEMSALDDCYNAGGWQSLLLLAEQAGEYRLEIRAIKQGQGAYRLRIVERHAAIASDQDRLRAQRLVVEAQQLYRLERIDERKRAILKLEEALPIFQSLADDNGVAHALFNLGGLHNLTGEKRVSLTDYQRALQLYRAANNRRGEATTLIRLGSIHNQLSEKQQAMDYRQEALALWRALGDPVGEAEALFQLGAVYDSLGEHRLALDLLQQALANFRAADNRRGQTLALFNIASSYAHMGDLQQTFLSLRQSLGLARILGLRQMEAVVLTELGRIYKKLADKEKDAAYYGQALEHYKQAQSILAAIADPRQEAILWRELGNLHEALGDRQNARDCYERALPLARRAGARKEEMLPLASLARIARERGDLAQARSRMEEAFGLLEFIRATVQGENLRASYFALYREYQDFYLDLLMDEHRLAPAVGHDRAAFEASERARARNLVETLGETRADPARPIPPALIERERDLRAQLDNKALEQTRLSDKKDDAPKAEAIAQEIRRLIAEHELILWKIQTANPRETALAQPQSFKTDEIQQLLDADTLLLEYALGEERSYLFALTDKTFHSYELPKREVIETAAKRYYELLTARNRPIKFEEPAQRARRLQQAGKDLGTAGVELSRMIFRLVAAELRQQRLLIVADGALQLIPFAALPKPGTGDRRPRTGKKNPQPPIPNPQHLIFDHEVVHLPSASALAVLRRELKDRKPAPKLLAVLADPVFDAVDGRVKSSLANAQAANDVAPTRGEIAELTRAVSDLGAEDVRGALMRLPYTRQEAEAIVRLAPAGSSKLALDFDASQSVATSEELSQYRYVHFATHGILNNQHPALSGIVLSLVDRDGNEQDGFLRMIEVFNLKLPAEMVVLSGCKTGLGKDIKGEGLIGLTRGFMYAGAARVMVSLWDVNDRATADLMSRTYHGILQNGASPAAALRAAQLEMLKSKQWRAPYFWAPFVLMGEPR